MDGGAMTEQAAPLCYSCHKRPATTSATENATGIARQLCAGCRWTNPAEADAMDALSDAFEEHGWTVEIGYGSGGMMGIMLSLDGLYDRDVDTSAVYSLAHGYSGAWGIGRYANVDDLGYGAHQWWEPYLYACPDQITPETIDAAALVERVDAVIVEQEGKRADRIARGLPSRFGNARARVRPHE